MVFAGLVEVQAKRMILCLEIHEALTIWIYLWSSVCELLHCNVRFLSLSCAAILTFRVSMSERAAVRTAMREAEDTERAGQRNAGHAHNRPSVS